MFENELADLHKYYETHQAEIARAEQVMQDVGLTDLEPFVTRSWIYAPTDTESRHSHPDWPTRESVWRGVVHIHLWFPFEVKNRVRELCLAAGLEWRKSYHLNNAAWPRKVNFFEETWTWNPPVDPREIYDNDEINLLFYRPVTEGEVIDGCKVIRHTQKSSEYTELVLSCKMTQE